MIITFRILSVVSLTWIIFSTTELKGGDSPNIQPYSRIYFYLRELKLRGYFEELNLSILPLKRVDIRGQLNFYKEPSEDPYENYLLSILKKELQAPAKSQDSFFDPFKIGLFSTSSYEISDQSPVKSSELRTKFLLDLGPDIQFYNSILFGNSLDSDPGYIGRSFRSIEGFTEQGYLQATLFSGKFDLLLGRDFLRWGPGRHGTLHVSDNSRPFDMIKLTGSHKNIKYTSIFAELDIINQFSRYFAAHRLDLNIWNQFFISVTESILYTSKNQGVRIAYLNPFISFYGLNVNGGNPVGNIFISVDFSWYLKNKYNLWLEFLIDDYQIDSDVPGDLEPNELGIITGMELADPLGYKGVTVTAEYTRITNRTYKTPNIAEWMLHRNKQIGYSLGSDFDKWNFQLSKWIKGPYKVAFTAEVLRRGEGEPNIPWDQPWFDFTVEEGYSEPFPTGIVERATSIGFEFLYEPSLDFNYTVKVQKRYFTNVKHLKGIKSDNWTLFLSLLWDIDLF